MKNQAIYWGKYYQIIYLTKDSYLEKKNSQHSTVKTKQSYQKMGQRHEEIFH